jgi:hypothetical protein
MSRRARIAVSLTAISAIGALGIIIFNINERGHYVYCGAEGCLSTTAFGRFALPFMFLLVKYAVVLFSLWLVLATLLQIRKIRSQPREQPNEDYWIR